MDFFIGKHHFRSGWWKTNEENWIIDNFWIGFHHSKSIWQIFLFILPQRKIECCLYFFGFRIDHIHRKVLSYLKIYSICKADLKNLSSMTSIWCRKEYKKKKQNWAGSNISIFDPNSKKGNEQRIEWREKFFQRFNWFQIKNRPKWR